MVQNKMASITRRTIRERVKQSVSTNVNELLNPYFWVEVLVEFVVSAFVAIIVIWALTTLNEHAYKPSTTHFGLFAGMAVVALIEGYGPLCGAPLNPAGNLGFFLAGRITLVRAIMYSVFETAGAATGAMIGITLTPTAHAEAFKPIMPGPGVSVGMGIAIEGILTFNLLVVALTCTNPKTKTCIMPSFPLAFCIGGGIFAAGTHTGGLQNPLISFGPAVASKNFTMHFPVYWGGPFIGATVGAVFYILVTKAKKHFDRTQVSKQPENGDDSSKKTCELE